MRRKYYEKARNIIQNSEKDHVFDKTAVVVLRLLFHQRLRVWAAKNEKWQALEAVVVRPHIPLLHSVSHLVIF